MQAGWVLACNKASVLQLRRCHWVSLEGEGASAYIAHA